MTYTMKLLKALEEHGQLNNARLTQETGMTRNQVASRMSALATSGQAVRVAFLPQHGGGKPTPIWEITDKGKGMLANGGGRAGANGVHHLSTAPRVQRKAPGDPDSLSFADIKAVLGTVQAREILKLIEVAKNPPVVLNEGQIQAARWIVDYDEDRRFVGANVVFRKFFQETPASRRTFIKWLDALSAPAEVAE